MESGIYYKKDECYFAECEEKALSYHKLFQSIKDEHSRLCKEITQCYKDNISREYNNNNTEDIYKVKISVGRLLMAEFTLRQFGLDGYRMTKDFFFNEEVGEVEFNLRTDCYYKTIAVVREI